MANSPVLPHRYEQVAGHVRRMLEAGTYAVQDKLPSVRGLSQQLQVSITTVTEAYRLLEDQGLIEARPQSGYYVSPPRRMARPEPLLEDSLETDPISVGMGEFLMRQARDFQRKDLVQFGAASANPAHLPTAKLARALSKVARDENLSGNNYDLPPGCEPLRVQIARRALNAGCVVSPEDVVLTLGCQEALILCLRATTQPGDTVVVESPTYYGHLQAIEMLGLKVCEVPTDPVDGFSLPALRQALADCSSIRVAMLCPSFSNPTGASLSEEGKRELLEILAKYNVPLIEDDIFGELSHTPQRPPAARSYDERDMVLLCSSFSKTLAPGYRVGWIVAGPRWVHRIHQLKLFSNLGSPVLPALAINEFLKNGGYDHHLRHLRRIYARLTHQMAEAVIRYFPAGTQVTRPQGGFVLWVELAAHQDTRLLYPRALQAGLTFGPGPIFSARGKFRNFLRLCVPYYTPETDPMLARLAALIR